MRTLDIIGIIWFLMGIFPCIWALKNGGGLGQAFYALILLVLGPIGFLWMLILGGFAS